MFRGKIFGLLLCLLIGLSAVGMADGYTFDMNVDAVVKVSGGENTVTEMVIPSSVRKFDANLSEYLSRVTAYPVLIDNALGLVALLLRL